MKHAARAALCALFSAFVFAGCAVDNAPAGARPIEMTPTEAELAGAFDSYLFVPLDGETYRYERADGPEEEVTAGELIFSFVEDTGFDQYDWSVYSVREYPDRSRVWAITGMGYGALYRYSPSKGVEPGALERAKETGYVVMEDGDVSFGQDAWFDFAADAGAGKKASVMLAHYYTLDPDNCDPQYYEAYREDYPVLYLQELAFDGEKYTLSWEEDGAQHVKSYEHMMRYTGEAPTPYATYDSYLRYVLTHDDTVTWEDLFYSAASSQFGAYIDHYNAYTDLEMK